LVIIKTDCYKIIYSNIAHIGCERISGPAANGNIINPIQSARLRTIDSVALRYGKVEVRARLPKGDWLW
jgi:beta-glucanase (GH16 family)